MKQLAKDLRSVVVKNSTVYKPGRFLVRGKDSGAASGFGPRLGRTDGSMRSRWDRCPTQRTKDSAFIFARLLSSARTT